MLKQCTRDIIIGYTLGILNFVRLSSCDGNVTFQNLTLRKATIASESYLIGYTSSNRYPHMQIIFTMNDTKLENVYEKKNSLSYLRKSVLILSVAGSSRLDINRLYLDRVLIKCKYNLYNIPDNVRFLFDIVSINCVISGLSNEQCVSDC